MWQITAKTYGFWTLDASTSTGLRTFPEIVWVGDGFWIAEQSLQVRTVRRHELQPTIGLGGGTPWETRMT